MCCELCPEVEYCEGCLGGAECCCPRCSEYEDCSSRLELDYVGLGEGGGADDFEFWPQEDSVHHS